MRSRIAIIVVTAIAGVGYGFAWSFVDGRAAAPAASKGLPAVRRDDGYVGSDACRKCHPGEHASWHRSHHRTMTQVASTASVVAAFDGAAVDAHGERHVPAREGGDYVVERYALDGRSRTWRRAGRMRVVMTTGSHHVQVYWYDAGDGRLGLVPIAWLIAERRWVPRSATFLEPARAHADDGIATWNTNCIGCHATAATPGARAGGFASSAVDLGIACEACHGPGARHVRANRDPVRRYVLHASGAADDTIANPARMTGERATEVCGSCHGMSMPRDMRAFLRDGIDYRPGDQLVRSRRIARDNRVLGIDRDGTETVAFWPDGVVLAVGREYNGIVASSCYPALTCTTCHAMHRDGSRGDLDAWATDQLRPIARDGRVCTTCHEETAAHTHHAAGSPGTDCYGCHMPHTSYGLLAAQRSHAIASPTVAESIDAGRPNACNLCHLDRSLAWTGGWLAHWYGQPADARAVDGVAAGVVWIESDDPIQRVVAAWSMGASGAPWVMPHLERMLGDPVPAARIVAERALRRIGAPIPSVPARPPGAGERKVRVYE